ncbi:MAG TPA: hypothetical protein VHT70_04615 [Candidatus Saccharimonadales bacterium]|jgi:hypothetical protein|nr:hypothetical protein [Candidatus Saccharimonadales bacterium]
MKRVGNVIAAAGLGAALLVPAGSAEQEHSPHAELAAVCNFERPDQQTLQNEKIAMQGLAQAIDEQYDGLPSRYHDDSGKPQPATAIDLPLAGNGRLTIGYHAPDRAGHSRHANAMHVDDIWATAYAASAYKKPVYEVELQKLCDNGWRGIWRKDNGQQTVETDGNYHVTQYNVPEPLPDQPDQQLGIRTVEQLVNEMHELTMAAPGYPMEHLSAPTQFA